jgi:hypothetical protein
MKKITQRRKFTKKKRERFLELLRETGLVAKSAAAVGIAKVTIDRYRKKDKEFGEAVVQAIEEYRDKLEAELTRRAVEGVETPVFGNLGPGLGTGEVGHVRKYSDKLLLELVKKHIPGFRDKIEVDANVTGGVLIVAKPPSEEEWLKEHDDAPTD